MEQSHIGAEEGGGGWTRAMMSAFEITSMILTSCRTHVRVKSGQKKLEFAFAAAWTPCGMPYA